MKSVIFGHVIEPKFVDNYALDGDTATPFRELVWSIVGHRDPTVPDLFHRDKAAIHPHTSQLVYSNSPSLDAPGFSITPIFSRATPRSLPTPAVLPPGKQLSISHDGHWIVVFHPSPAGESGTIAIYPSSILSPTVNPSSVVPLTTLSLSSSPLANQHLYPTHFHTSTSRALQLGPRPPPSHNATRGPTFLLLTTTSLLLFHPHLLGSDPETSLVRDTAPNGSLQQWGMNVLRCPIHTRWHANVGEPPPLEAGPRARRGWIGLMVGEEGVWCAVEIGREVRVLRAEVGSHGSGRYYLQTLPMPPLPRLVPPPFPDAPEVTVETDLQGVVFNLLQDDLKIPVSQTENAVDSVGVVLVYEDFQSGPTSSTAHSLDIPARTRFETCKFEKREVELVKGFEEIGSGYGDTMTSSWDWFTSSRSIRTSLGLIGNPILALHPLPSVPPYTLALAVSSTTTCTTLFHINLNANSFAPVGETVDLVNMRVAPEHGLGLSQSARRGQMGLVTLFSEYEGMLLIVAPRLTAGDAALSALENSAMAAAQAIVLATKQGTDWSDVIRAGYGAVPKASLSTFVNPWLRRTWNLLVETSGPGELETMIKVQIGIFSWTDDVRLEVATELLRLTEASGIFDECATFGEHGKIAFELESVWPLLAVVEWVLSVLARSMREVIFEHAKAVSDENKDGPVATRVIYLVHPSLRPIIIRLLSQVRAFASFLQDLRRPISQPESRFLPAGVTMNPKATLVAREWIEGLIAESGVDLVIWGKALEEVEDTPGSNEDLQLSLLTLDPSLLRPFPAFPDPASLFMSAHEDDEVDAITFLPLSGGIWARCNRCRRKTADLRGAGHESGLKAGWKKWRAERERGCGCGGCWVECEEKVGH